jgi:hypothetical protein
MIGLGAQRAQFAWQLYVRSRSKAEISDWAAQGLRR